ncbi:MAG: LptF/LptG family permease [Candidatus Omnitrophica bacterium]|nr:LptF/LptG family permease [Candidatus Omnitrophota bacterium]MDD4940643.1 LptF/LptG family permease [Candidatus Omnitrophota bacterium]MDD5774508.1 LptF/LptG family permease [Candidatus Omnitrophota bacterium]HNQ50562.1 LptF/LptG family permease [Candidatus Omnitrophota bacterium]HQO37507.1 LptF/LptG family permease [Candidatus Omnitrophota bacterium]
MKILRNYVIKEFLGPLIGSLLVLTFVMILGNLVKIADLVINKGVDILSVVKLFLFMMPALLTYTVPIATLVAVLLSLGRLSGDNEIVTMRASGINLAHIVMPLLVIGAVMSLVLLIFNDRIVPYAHFAQRKTLVDVGTKNPAAALEPGIFINTFDKYILFIYAIDGNRLQNVRIYEPQGEDKPTRLIIARRGEFISVPESNIVKLKLMDGTADEPDPDNPSNFYKLNFKTYFMSLNIARAQSKENILKKPKDMTIRELEAEMRALRAQKIDPSPLATEVHKKISLAFSCLVFILLGMPMAVITHRREKSINFGIAFLIVGVYYLLLLGSEALSRQGYLDPQFALWIPNTLFGLAGGILTYKLCAY